MTVEPMHVRRAQPSDGGCNHCHSRALVFVLDLGTYELRLCVDCWKQLKKLMAMVKL